MARSRAEDAMVKRKCLELLRPPNRPKTPNVMVMGSPRNAPTANIHSGLQVVAVKRDLISRLQGQDPPQWNDNLNLAYSVIVVE